MLYNYEQGAMDNLLLQTIVALTIVLLKREGNDKKHAHARHLLHIQQQLRFKVEEASRAVASVDQFQQACLLAYYAFHQFPGESSWQLIGNLCRKAYKLGLHQLDNPTQPPAIIFACINQVDIECWRRIWWFIYTLDSYSNIAAGIPCLLERESFKTALPRPFPMMASQNPLSPLFLDDPDGLWKVVQDIFIRGIYVNENLHIVTTAILNEAANIQRRSNQNPSSKLHNRLLSDETHLSAIRLALVPRYLDPARNMAQNESSSEYHARLVCILHLHVTRLLLFMPICVSQTEVERQDRWHRTQECCSDVVAVIKQWDGANSPNVDPAICIIAFVTLCLLLLHSKYVSKNDLVALERLELDQRVLLLFLEHFGHLWELPKHLICKILPD
jgi:hypothetical protein